MSEIRNVLFVCTGNSARSIMAEGILGALGRGRFRAFSAGSQPKGAVHPLALRQLERMRIGTEGFRSKPWEEFAAPGAPEMHFVFTVCDQAAGEVCPVWPGQPMTAHWGVPDPVAVTGPEEVQDKAFIAAAATLKRRLELFVALPLETLERMAIQKELRDIGSR